ncbi:MAG: hypothetical protein AAFV88_20780 [Planctomycetota bacterium]
MSRHRLGSTVPVAANPYQTPALIDVEQKPQLGWSHSRFALPYRLGAWLIALLYPVWLLGSFYLTWLIAWSVLGHRPRPMLDDPTSVGGIATIAYYLSGLMLLLMPALAPLGLAASAYCPFLLRRRARLVWRVSFALLYVAIFIATIALLRADPGRVVEWWFD